MEFAYMRYAENQKEIAFSYMSKVQDRKALGFFFLLALYIDKKETKRMRLDTKLGNDSGLLLSPLNLK